MLKNATIYGIITSQRVFYAILLRCCRDGADLNYNKEAWKLFYTTFRDHHGMLQSMETEGNFLNQFLEIISPGVGNIVTTNCIYYCSKFLKLLDCETIKVQETGKTSRGDEDLKLVERDVKVFITALIKHSLRVHLIYKRLTFQGDKNTKQNLGAPYIVSK